MDILNIIHDLKNRLYKQYGNPLSSYLKTQDDVHMTYYVGKLMEEVGHQYIMPSSIAGPKEDSVYWSEKALHDAFLAGRLVERVERKRMRQQIMEEMKEEMKASLDQYCSEYQ
jgi:hypothetical protein